MMKHHVLTTALALAVGAVGISCDKVKPPQPELKTEPPATGAPAAQTKNPDLGLSEVQRHLDKLESATRESWSQVTETFKISLDKLKGAVKDASDRS